MFKLINTWWRKIAEQTEGREEEHYSLQMSCCMKDPGIFETVNLNVNAVGHSYQAERWVGEVGER